MPADSQGPKLTGTPGHVPDLPDDKPAVKSIPEGMSAARAKFEATTRDLRKKPKPHIDKDTGKPNINGLAYTVEFTDEDKALAAANVRGKAVAGPRGWVCPSVIKERPRA